MVDSRLQAVERRACEAESSSTLSGLLLPGDKPEAPDDEERLDRLLDKLLECGILSEVQLDRVTDSLATGESTVQQCLAHCSQILK